MKAPLALALIGLSLATPAAAADACYTMQNVSNMHWIDSKTLNVDKLGKNRDFQIKFANTCAAYYDNRGLVINHRGMGLTECIDRSTSASDSYGSACMIDSVTPLPDAKPSAPQS